MPVINELNVFPVPDGDTGANMHHTLQRAWQEITSLDSRDASQIAERFAYGALMGARGNSGTILSQLLQGFAQGCDGAERLSTERLHWALEKAVATAYDAVSQPVEGTILTVIREAATSARRATTGDMPPADTLNHLISGARRSLNNTPDLLPVLKEAGVVDAGGMGLLCFLQGMRGSACEPGESLDDILDVSAAPATRLPISVHTEYGYDVQFLMRGANLDVAAVRRGMEDLGDSVLVVGDQSAIKVHVHVANPALPIDHAIKAGAMLDDVVIENMQLQAEAFSRQPGSAADFALEPAPLGAAVVAVATGEGIRAVFEGLHCSAVVAGGAGASPATEDMLRAIQEIPAEHVFVLPNDRNIIMPARQAADLVANKRARVLPSRTILEGISAVIAFGDARDDGADLAATEARMREAISNIYSIEITRATRPASVKGVAIAKDDFLAILDGEIVAACDDLESVVLSALMRIGDDDVELATLYYGATESEADAHGIIARLRKEINDIEFELIYGGQDLYPYLISVE